MGRKSGKAENPNQGSISEFFNGMDIGEVIWKECLNKEDFLSKSKMMHRSKERLPLCLKDKGFSIKGFLAIGMKNTEELTYLLRIERIR